MGAEPSTAHLSVERRSRCGRAGGWARAAQYPRRRRRRRRRRKAGQRTGPLALAAHRRGPGRPPEGHSVGREERGGGRGSNGAACHFRAVGKKNLDPVGISFLKGSGKTREPETGKAHRGWGLVPPIHNHCSQLRLHEVRDEFEVRVNCDESRSRKEMDAMSDDSGGFIWGKRLNCLKKTPAHWSFILRTSAGSRKKGRSQAGCL